MRCNIIVEEEKNNMTRMIKTGCAAALLGALVACSEGGQPAGAVTTGDGGANDSGASAGVLQLGLTVHLENHAPYDQTYLDRLRAYGTLFKNHGAKLTLEPRQEMWQAVTGANATLFSDLQAQGHSFAVHAALGNAATLSQFVTQLTQLRTELSQKNVTVQHASGQCQALDWVTGSVSSGFLAMTGGTENCLLALSAGNRPAGYENLSCAKPTDCHGVYPKTTAEKMHPWRAKQGSDWLTDHADGQLVILSSSGTLPCLEEEAAHPGQLSTCTFTQGDIDRSKVEIDAALALVDKDKINQLYFVWSFGLELSDAMLEAWFAMLKPYIDQGRVAWKTESEVYDGYVTWEKTHR